MRFSSQRILPFVLVVTLALCMAPGRALGITNLMAEIMNLVLGPFAVAGNQLPLMCPSMAATSASVSRVHEVRNGRRIGHGRCFGWHQDPPGVRLPRKGMSLHRLCQERKRAAWRMASSLGRCPAVRYGPSSGERCILSPPAERP